MTQLTIRGDAWDLEAKLRELADKRGWSLDQAATYLLRKGANLPEDPPPAGTTDELDSFVGSWSEAERQAFDTRVAAAHDVIDEELWK